MSKRRMADLLAALRDARAKRTAEQAERVRQLKHHRERWELAEEKIAHIARRYGREHPGGPRALAAYLRKHIDGWGGRDPFSGVDPVHVVDSAIEDMFGRRLAWEREQAMRAMGEQEHDEPAT